jgi:copper chaperone NosL
MSGIDRMVFRLLMIIAFLLMGCSKEEAEGPLPLELGQDHACGICGMILVEYPGPKAQIHYKNGEPETFCCTPHMFMAYLNPERPRNIRAVYVHDMGEANWDHPQHYWIDAKEAFFVYGGDKMGAMGETMVPFSTSKDAETYVKDHGGRTIKFDEITLDMLKPKKHSHSSAVLRQTQN